jgi:hypothetical protein
LGELENPHAELLQFADTAAQLHLQAFPVHRKSFPAPSLLARKNSLIDILGNSSPRALKLLQECAPVFMKLARFPPISLLFPSVQGICPLETGSIWAASTTTESAA